MNASMSFASDLENMALTFTGKSEHLPLFYLNCGSHRIIITAMPRRMSLLLLIVVLSVVAAQSLHSSSLSRWSIESSVANILR